MPLRGFTQLRVSISGKGVLFIRASLAALEVRSKPEASACPAPDPFGNECQGIIWLGGTTIPAFPSLEWTDIGGDLGLNKVMGAVTRAIYPRLYAMFGGY